MNERTLAWIGIIGVAVLYSVIKIKYLDTAPRSSRSVAITPIAIISVFLGISAAAYGVATAFMFMMFIIALYVVGVVAQAFSEPSAR